MLLHVRKHARLVLKEQHMAKLVHFVKAYHLRIEQLFHIRHVVAAGGEAGYARAGEGYLGS